MPLPLYVPSHIPAPVTQQPVVPLVSLVPRVPLVPLAPRVPLVPRVPLIPLILVLGALGALVLGVLGVLVLGAKTITIWLGTHQSIAFRVCGPRPVATVPPNSSTAETKS